MGVVRVPIDGGPVGTLLAEAALGLAMWAMKAH